MSQKVKVFLNAQRGGSDLDLLDKSSQPQEKGESYILYALFP